MKLFACYNYKTFSNWQIIYYIKISQKKTFLLVDLSRYLTILVSWSISGKLKGLYRNLKLFSLL